MIRKPVLQIYHEAISDDHSSLYVNLMNKDKRKGVCKDSKYLIPN